jgi:hypothetical protein
LSEGGAGGAGGSITSVVAASAASTSQAVLAAGAGGQGLTAGGAGGSVISSNVDAGSASGSGKVVIIAGDGGAAVGAKPTSTSVAAIAAAIGGVNGPGGAGGSITGFTQPLSVNTDVDLIAGNGGNTPSHSVEALTATTDNAGRGGSITNISVAGNIGNPDTTTAILSYNNIYTGITANGIANCYTMQQFVDNYILGDPTAPMDDSIGNVGLVAGANGYVQGPQINGQPGPLVASLAGVNGSVTDVHAENIMSMIAGNVDDISLIHNLTDYGTTINGGILGASKGVWYDPQTGTTETIVDGVTLAGPTTQLNYIAPDGSYSATPLPGGGELIDGAFVAFNFRTVESIRDFQGTEVVS